MAKEDLLDEKDDERARLEECTRSTGEALLDHVRQEENVCVGQVYGEVLHYALGVIEDIRGGLLSRSVDPACRRG